MNHSFYSFFILFSIALILFGCDEEKYLVLPTDTPIITYAGKVYHTVTIGSQTWLKENLNVGIMIDSTKDQTNNGIIEKYCYHDSTANCEKYGGLYKWAEAVQYQNGVTNTTMASPALTGNVQGICPTGWHIPSLTEFQTLSTTVSSNSNSLKAVGQGMGQYRGTNASGFSALLAGNLYGSSNFNGLGSNTDFWSSTENGAVDAYGIFLYYNNSSVSMNYNYEEDGFSIRCLKDN